MGEIFEYERPDNYIVSSEKYSDSYPIPVLTANQAFVLGYTNETVGIYDKGPVILFDDFTCDMKYSDFPFKVKSSAIKLLTPKKGIPIFYAYCLLQHINYKPEGHARHWISIMQPINVLLPGKTEQNRISELLSLVCKRIEKQQRVIDLLKKYKRGALSKLFPQKGETVPKYRFAGFDEAWEQRKLGELAERTYGGGTPNTSNLDYWKGDIAWLQSSDIADGKLFDVVPKKFISLAGLSNSAAQLVPENSIAIITRVGVGKLAFLPFSYTTSQDFLSMSKLKTEPFFTVYACYKKLQSELNAVQGTSIKGITKDELLAKKIMVPKYDEQKQIGDFFKRLDNLITLHHRKLDELQIIKAGLLQKLFI